MQRATSVDAFIEQSTLWREELTRLRDILRATSLQEEIKWGAPCYTHNGKNVVGIGAFKAYFGLWFHQGALLKDDKNVLINAQEGKTKAMRRHKGATQAFRNLGRGRQREYAEYVATAKRDDTKLDRVAKILPMITAGVGLNDKYRR